MSGGKFEFDDGGFYVGEWHDGEASGFGVCTGPENLGKFEGLWENGVEVSGVYTWPNDTHYKGQWKEGQRQGFGKEVFGQLDYSGEWMCGLKHGSGVIKTGKNKRPCFEGTWKNGLQDGHGVEIYKEGGFYAGHWKEGCRHGYGIRGFADLDRLQDGAISIRQILMQNGSPRSSRGATLSGSSDLEEKPLKKTFSVPTKLNHQSTIDLVTGKLTNEVADPNRLALCKPRERVSVFQMVMNNFKKAAPSAPPDPRRNELYKGAWDGDLRHGPGICFYEDGSKFIGLWKENLRHGYGLFIDHVGEKSGGKWYNDNLILMTRRKNLKLPMVKKKIKRSVLDAIDAAEKASRKTKLAITRGLAARKLAEEAEIAAVIASGDAEKAQDYRRIFTLHPLLEATLKNTSRRNSAASLESLHSTKSTPNLSKRESFKKAILRKRSMFSLLGNGGHEELRKKTSVLSKVDNTENFDMDVLHSFQKHPVSESALYSAMDTTIGAGAFNPYLSQMVLMQYNDAQTRITNTLTQKSAISDQLSSTTHNMFASALVPMVMNMPTDLADGLRIAVGLGDDADSQQKSSLSNSMVDSSVPSRKSSSSSVESDQAPSPVSSPSIWRSLPGLHLPGSSSTSPALRPRRALLHPKDCSKRRRSGVANMSLDSDSSIASEDARLVQMKGKLLTGDEVSYSYVALNTAVEGKETIVLYTDHPKPKFQSDFSISDKALVNSSTGLYRTLVGDVPRVLNVATPTGIPSLDNISRRESVDSGTANDETDFSVDSRGYVSSRKDKQEGGGNDKLKAPPPPIHINKDGTRKVRYSFSPSFEEKQRELKKSDTIDQKDDTSATTTESTTPPPSYDEVTKDSKQSGVRRNTQNGGSVRVCQRTGSVNQVVINQRASKFEEICKTEDDSGRTSSVSENNNIPEKKRPSSLIETSSSSKSGGGKSRFFDLISKKFWGHSNHSIRSMSTDSGYKKSMSIDDTALGVHLSPKTVRYSPQPPIDEVGSDAQVSQQQQREDGGVTGTTVVTIENDKFRKLNSVTHTSKKGSMKRNSLKKRANGNLKTESGGDDDVFDQNKTIEQSPHPSRKVQLPTFFDPNLTTDSDSCSEGRQQTRLCVSEDDGNKNSLDLTDDYVILGDPELAEGVPESGKFETPGHLTWV